MKYTELVHFNLAVGHLGHNLNSTSSLLSMVSSQHKIRNVLTSSIAKIQYLVQPSMKMQSLMQLHPWGHCGRVQGW